MTQSEMLALWEAGQGLAPLDRAVLAARATSRNAEGNAADWPLGMRNRVLARLHCAQFGGVLCGFTRCRECGEQLEFNFDARTVAEARPQQSEQCITVGKWLFRLPTSRILAVAAGEVSEQAATRRLLSECWAGAEPPAIEWTDEDVQVIEERLAEADPFAEIQLHFDCPGCSTSFDENLDLGTFVWADIDDYALRTLREIHALASAYGWSESEILSLSPARRAAYLEMVLA
jgi:hypothetical protein